MMATATKGKQQKKRTIGTTMPDKKYVDDEYVIKKLKTNSAKYWELHRYLEAAKSRYEHFLRDAGKEVDNPTPTGYFNRGKQAAYDKIVLDLMRWLQV
jgi:hypothetical protein